ncbi:MAG: DUF4325 domain-containing protein [Alphaproteobacteria bacterium]|nr:DUF4325 domain-containing protein [Alphaproteobacteria bacterium]MDA7987003.1 DUF4325 domain-containing protein [Alphaproteobacteria bacterium]MDA8000377.1 DUF4325 domain-containing protein [Alphaproteobacteria bacterium]MDA8003606.1 DUF4325 domain-containing protein [Alphaproteobacteria bacterium]MDA8005619.1 DUF4325 domain-containing protein [Alphaproteobacteria bacterium]
MSYIRESLPERNLSTPMQSQSPKAEVDRSSNRLILKNGPFGEAQVPYGVLHLHKIIDGEGYTEVIFDASQCTFCSPGFMVPMIAQMERYREEKDVSYTLVMPQHNQSLKRLFKNANWAHIIGPNDHVERSRDNYGNYIPLRNYRTDGEMHVLVNEAIESILHTTEIHRESLHGVEWSLNEIADNVLQHSESPVGGFLQLNVSQNRSLVEFFVADAGMGIPKTLRIDDHEKALHESIKFGGTKDASNNAGNGLYGSFRTALFSRGSFSLNSGKASLFLSRGKEGPSINTRNILYHGTFVSCALDYNDPEAFQKALRWSEDSDEDRVGYLDIEYGKGETVSINMNDHRSFFGSREGGKKFRQKLKNLLRENKPIRLDFSGVSVITSSFADESLAKLAKDIGQLRFMSRIQLTGMNETVELVIERAMRHRLALSNGNRGGADDEGNDEGGGGSASSSS